MKIAAGVLTWNTIVNKREQLLERTVESLKPWVDHLVVADNGSSDGTAAMIKDMPEGVLFPRIAGFPHGNTCGYGMNKLAATLAETDAEVIVLSNDDIVWSDGVGAKLRSLYEDKLYDDTVIVSGLVEPEYALPGQPPWNAVLDVIKADERIQGIKLNSFDLWFRRSVPGGAWTFRRSHIPLIFPVSTFPGVDDVPACERLLEEGYRVAAAELAEHAGLGQSTWGNASHDRYLATDLETLKAGWTT